MARPAKRVNGNSHPNPPGHTIQLYTQQLEDGSSVELSHAGGTEFDCVKGKFKNFEIGSKVCLKEDHSLTGTVKWIGRHHPKTSSPVADTAAFIIGVKMDPACRTRIKCTHGDLNSEQLVHTPLQDIVFAYFSDWTAVRNERPVPDRLTTNHANLRPSSVSSNDHMYAQHVAAREKTKFEKMPSGHSLNGFQVGSRVVFEGYIGTIGWIGHRVREQTKVSDYIVGVALDSPSSRNFSITDGTFEGERLIHSNKKNVKFTKLKYVKLAVDRSTDPSAPPMPKSHQKDFTAQTTADGIQIEMYHSPDSKFDELVGDGLTGLRNGMKVYYSADKKQSGTVKWIGCYHYRACETPAADFIVGVKLDKPKQWNFQGKLTKGSYESEPLAQSDKMDVVFIKLKYWSSTKAPIQETGSSSDYHKKRIIQTTSSGTRIELCHYSASKFDDVVGEGINSIAKGVKVYLDMEKDRSGIVRWMGCYHNKACETSDSQFIVGVKLDKPEQDSFPEGLTNGSYDDEELVESSKKDIKFVELKHCSPADAPIKDTGIAKCNEWTVQATADSLPVETRHSPGSKYDEVVGGGLKGFVVGVKVCIFSEKHRSGTVKWIGCLHNQACDTPAAEFIVCVKLDNPELEAVPEALTTGFYDGEWLTNSSVKDVKFVKLQYCSLTDARVTETKSAKDSEETFQATASGARISIRHNHGSEFDEVVAGDIAGFARGVRVYLNSDESRSGKVKWVGCSHNRACDTFETDFIVGIKMDKPEQDSFPEGLTDGSYEGEDLVRSSKKDMKFIKLQYCSLADVPVKDTVNAKDREWTTQTTADGHQIETRHSPNSNYDEVVRDGLDGFRVGVRVYLLSEKSRSGTVEWIGCHHNRVPETPKSKFIVGVKLDNPDLETIQDALTDGVCNKERLVTSSKMDMKFVELLQCSLLQDEVPETGRGGAEYNDRNLSLRSSQLASHLHKTTIGQHNSGVTCVSDSPETGQHHSERLQQRQNQQNAVSSSIDPPRSRSGDVSRQLRDDPELSMKHTRGSLSRQHSDGYRRSEDAPPKSQNFRESVSLQYKNLKSELAGHTTTKTQPVSLDQQHLSSGERNAREASPVRESVRGMGRQNDDQPLSVYEDHFSTYNKKDVRGHDWPFEEPNEQMLLKGMVLKRDDNTYYTTITPVERSQKDLVEDKELGELLHEVVDEYVLPPTHPYQYSDRWKGVQGDLNSCYMDACIFAMFSYLTIFDNILFPSDKQNDKKEDDDFRRTESIREVLRTRIVAPLRKYGLAQKKGMHELRKLLAEWGLVKGLTEDEKDPEEFLNLLLVNTFVTPSPIVLSNGQESHLFQIYAEKEDNFKFPTVQELVERTCLQEKFKFKKIPPYLILNLPRFGKAYKMYDQVMPSMELDVTDLLAGAHQSCYVCGNDAHYECYGCYKEHPEFSKSSFCGSCIDDYHQAKTRRHHQPQVLEDMDKHEGFSSAKCVLKLAAVLCIETSHYVAFVGSDTTADAEWYFFDSMADREGTTNIPKVERIPKFRQLLSEVTEENINKVSPLLRRLVKDGYICFYANPDLSQYNALKLPDTITDPRGVVRL
ncbi:ubiquitin carboxyl-terminal hydrolase CYLD-like [Watersipora subatra]|uniref:ubiquitin carboxyl-terminal hydrolase CYLD-like n=1 Tax=Watersipora subatra TaxID=2589382 RepID=UPI00355AD682